MQRSGETDGTPTVERETMVLNYIPTRQGRTLRYADGAKLKIEYLLAGETPEVVVVSAPGRLVAWLLAWQLHDRHLPLLPERLDRSVNRRDPQSRDLCTCPPVYLLYGKWPLGRHNLFDNGISLLRKSRGVHASNISTAATQNTSKYLTVLIALGEN